MFMCRALPFDVSFQQSTFATPTDQAHKQSIDAWAHWVCKRHLVLQSSTTIIQTEHPLRPEQQNLLRIPAHQLIINMTWSLSVQEHCHSKTLCIFNLQSANRKICCGFHRKRLTGKSQNRITMSFGSALLKSLPFRVFKSQRFKVGQLPFFLM